MRNTRCRIGGRRGVPRGRCADGTSSATRTWLEPPACCPSPTSWATIGARGRSPRGLALGPTRTIRPPDPTIGLADASDLSPTGAPSIPARQAGGLLARRRCRGRGYGSGSEPAGGEGADCSTPDRRGLRLYRGRRRPVKSPVGPSSAPGGERDQRRRCPGRCPTAIQTGRPGEVPRDAGRGAPGAVAARAAAGAVERPRGRLPPLLRTRADDGARRADEAREPAVAAPEPVRGVGWAESRRSARRIVASGGLMCAQAAGDYSRVPARGRSGAHGSLATPALEVRRVADERPSPRAVAAPMSSDPAARVSAFGLAVPHRSSSQTWGPVSAASRTFARAEAVALIMLSAVRWPDHDAAEAGTCHGHGWHHERRRSWLRWPGRTRRPAPHRPRRRVRRAGGHLRALSAAGRATTC